MATTRKATAPAPKPVHARNMQNHGLFGISNVRQHMMVDERWTPSSVTDEYKQMTDLLTKRYMYMKLKGAAECKRYALNFRSLRRQVSDGRAKLQMSLHGANSKNIRHCLESHKNMQRMYQNMPIHEVVRNINQRTFVMRKEKDRLQYRLEQLKKTYKNKLLERAFLENRMKYESLMVLEEDLKSREIRKNIENSRVRFMVIQNINTTYKKLIQILRQDSIFYEPILSSLDSDIQDQANFIKHILFLGMPAIADFKELNESYRKVDNNKLTPKRTSNTSTASEMHRKLARSSEVAKENTTRRMSINSRYARDTVSMRLLKTKLNSKVSAITLLKFATLCNSSTEVCSRIISQLDKNRKLHNIIANDTLMTAHLKTKKKYSEVLEAVLANNLDEDERERLNRIRELQEKIAEEGHRKAQIIAHMKDRANAYVVLRLSLWNLESILRHVDRPPKPISVVYPDSYLNLPLLKFEMFALRASPPLGFEDNVDQLLRVVQRKVYKLMKHYSLMAQVSDEETAEHVDEYQNIYLESTELNDSSDDEDGEDKILDEGDDSLNMKLLQSVPTRKQIKDQSAKIVEEQSKKEE